VARCEDRDRPAQDIRDLSDEGRHGAEPFDPDTPNDIVSRAHTITSRCHAIFPDNRDPEGCPDVVGLAAGRVEMLF